MKENGLIAEFLGKDHELNQCISAPQFHKSWDWLMSAVDEIETLSQNGNTYTFHISYGMVVVREHNRYRDAKDIIEMHRLPREKKRQLVYRAVVGFINQYKNQ